MNKTVTTASFFYISLFLSFFFFSEAAAQSTVRGIIENANNAEPLEAANVLLESVSGDISRGTATDLNGLYQFDGVEDGTYVFKVSYVGYKTYVDTLRLDWTTPNITKSVEMIPIDETLDDVIVTHTGREADLDAGQQKIGRVDLQRVPTPGGSGDLASYIQTLPGVVSTGDRGGNLFIRGGTPSENLVLMDGTMIYQPFHIIGFFSVFPEELVSNVDFYAGGYGPRFNGRTSSVLDVKIKNGDFTERNWSASVSPFLSEVFYEGPIKRNQSSVIVSARGSLIEQSSELYMDEKQPMRFNSQFIKWTNQGDEGSNCSALMMRTGDEGQLDYERGDVFRWNNFVLGGRCAALTQKGSVSFFDINMGVSHVSNEVGLADDPERTSNATIFNTQINLLQFVGDFKLDYGFYTNIRWLNYNTRDLFVSVQENEDVLLGSGLYLQGTIPLGKTLQFKPGVSTALYLNRYSPSVEPRIQLSWQPRGKKNEEFNAAFGIYRQPLTGITDFRDAGSAFSAWTTVPYGGEQMEATHALAGWRQTLGPYLDFSVEGYYKWLSNLPVSTWSTIAQFTTDITLADGEIYGGDFKLNFNTRTVYGSIGYGYSVTEYLTAQDHFSTWFGEPVQSYNPPHDRRHQVNAQMGANFGNFTINLSWQYGSGLPYTRPLGFDDLIRFEDSLPDVREDYGTPRVILDKPFTGRMPDFHRLNASVEQAFEFNALWLRLQAGAINAYDQRNLFYYDVYTQRRIDQLPLFPYVSLKVEKK